MSIYVKVRGWLECDKKQLAAIQALISSHDDDHYSSGWGTPRKHINWTYFVFYGADIQAQNLNWLLAQLRDIARIPPSDEDNDRVQGLFLASHEVDGMSEWQIRDGQVLTTPGDGRYRYLDA
ncbi:MAG: hypothetical protein ACRDOO_13090 [Actinomadura sp.]